MKSVTGKIRGINERENCLILGRKMAGQFLKQIRTDSNLSLEELADFVDMDAAAIQCVEDGTIANFGLILRVANTLGIDLFFSVRPRE